MKKRAPLIFDLVLVVVAAGFFCLWGLGDNSFGDGDQTIHSKVVQEIVQTGEWWAPTRYGKPYLNKPPFKMWLAAIAVSLLGESNFSYRLVDGLTGIAIALVVYVFARRLFRSRVAGLTATAALLGANMFLWGHGARVAVQDTMLVLLNCAALWSGWLLAEEIASAWHARSRSREIRLAVLGGVCVGLSVLTKNVVGYLPFVILAVYSLLSGRAWLLLREGGRRIFLALAISVLLPALYLVPRFITDPRFFRAMIQREIIDRAIEGYSNTRQTWYYVDTIVGDRLTVPPLLLLLALCWALFRVREREISFLLCWAVVPLVLFTLAESRLAWYLMPALPALALLIGGFLADCAKCVHQAFWDRALLSRPPAAAAYIQGAALLVALPLLGGNLWDNAASVLRPKERRLVDLVAEQGLKNGVRNLADPPVLVYNAPRLARAESFYWSMLGLREVQTRAELGRELERKRTTYLLTAARNFRSVAAIRQPTGYAFVPPWHSRKGWLVVIAYEQQPQGAFTPLKERISLADVDVLWGWSASREFHNRRVRTMASPRSALLIPGDPARKMLGAWLTIRALALRSALSLHVMLNDTECGEVSFARSGFSSQRCWLPPSAWENGSNVLILTANTLRGDDASLLLAADLELELGGGAN